MTSSGEIRSAADLAKIVRTVKEHRRVLFRGQNVDKPLLPRIARIAEERQLGYERVSQIEREMLDRFKRESVPFIRGQQPRDDWEWLLSRSTRVYRRASSTGPPMRSLPCRSLASDPPKGGTGGVIWVLEVEPDHEAALSPGENIFDLRRTFVVSTIPH